MTGNMAANDHRSTIRTLWIAIAVMAILSPIGVLLPAWLKGGAAWGEWSSEEIKELVGFVPKGFAQLESIWRAALPDYTVPGMSGPLGESIAYVISAAVGIAIVVALAWLLGHALAAKESDDN